MTEFEQARQTAVKLSGTLDVVACNPQGSNELVLIVKNYGNGDGLSIAFDAQGGRKCWTTVNNPQPHPIDGQAPKYHEDYKRFVVEGETFYPYSIDVSKLAEGWLQNGCTVEGICARLHYHMRGTWPDE